jgi:hypothetical protein
VTDRWHDNWRDEETPEEKIERRYATVDKLGEWSGQDKPTLMDTAKRLNAIKSEYGLSGEVSDEATISASRNLAVDKFRALGFDYEDVHALAMHRRDAVGGRADRGPQGRRASSTRTSCA